MVNAPQTVQAIRWHEIDDLQLDTIEVPKLKDDYVLVKNMWSGICAGDRWIWHQGLFIDRQNYYPAIMGHEGSSEVLELGKNVVTDALGQPLEVGDMVCYQDNVGCGKCVFCREGAVNVCHNKKVAAQKPGHMVQYFTYPTPQLIKVEGITPKQGALVEPASVALHGTLRAEIKMGDTVLILGIGPVGLFRVQHVRMQGAGKIIVSEPQEFKRKLARDLGADIVVDPREQDIVKLVKDATDGNGADVAFEDSGHAQLEAIDAVRPRGTVMITGVRAKPISINFTTKVMLDEVTIRGSNGYSVWWDRKHDYLTTAELMRTGRLKTDPVISHEFPIEKYDEAFKTSDDPSKAVKVIIKLT